MSGYQADFTRPQRLCLSAINRLPAVAAAVNLQAALRAKESGSTRFCMGAAWRGPSQVGPRQWERVLEMVRRIRGLGMEVRICYFMPVFADAQQVVPVPGSLAA